jgi:AGCS family alanine or glycine:cation symporter
MNELLTSLTTLSGQIAGALWGIPTTIVLLGVGIYLTFRLGFLQLRGFFHAWKILFHLDQKNPGDVKPYQALSAELSATIGTGNIAGVATAIALGGPGAVFWMWMTAIFGMATKFVEGTLSLRYRVFLSNGEAAGGPMYTLKNGLNMPILGSVFAIFALIASFGIGNMVQANSVVDGLTYIFPVGREQWQAQVILGLIMATLAGLVILGGIKRIANFAAMIVPLMALVYVGGALVILGTHYTAIPNAFATIFHHALNINAVGAAAIGLAIQYGVARGLFSNEAGLGSSPIAHAAARTNEPVRQGLIAMLGPFIDTIIICTMTALVIIIMGSWGENRPEGLMGAALSAYAFESGLGDIGKWIVGFGLMFFAFTTIIGWSYYGDRSAAYLFGEKAILPYRLLYVVAIVIGASIPLQLVWNFADIANIMMALPNLLTLILLSGIAAAMTRDYFERQKKAG